MQYIVTGGKRLEGKIRASGNKNSVFPCVAAALLTNEEVILENISNLRDTKVLIQILEKLGTKVNWDGSTLKLQTNQISHTTLPQDLMGKLRGSMVLVGAILARMGKVHFYHPGGDIIGQRSIETHLECFKNLGVSLKRDDIEFNLSFPDERNNGDCVIFLSESSVTACENIILAASLGKKKVIVKNCPKEPHILDLCKMLVQMGAKIDGIGGDTLEIQGVEKLSGTKFKIGIDYIEIGTYAVAAAITGGEVTIENLDSTDLDPVLEPLKRFGISVDLNGDKVTFSAERLKAIPKITTNIWPGFPTDLMSAAIVLATQCKGVTLCHDWMYESRMFFIDKLISMGANVTLADPHRVFVYGPDRLKGRNLETPDIRAGMALVLAGLIARGKSVINQAELIERGYEDVVGKLKSLGADIERVE
ncbi:UDP-N-acetylglucosamine 1-carboxyvinyltransferase [Candidatus Daviesbacteria bacterium RIFCSPHIGHO2_02_FULL_36_13]|uniref:UDP-N-acetylglucosamine 1-carboxyvinyltransferase n=1 Tax=Candidatus Daviesbacteria bacterium RIFCSPHIGHO2_02_FULL_36_13 TaxID=1797768 RepID=A0A1F5JNS5_9BACT|nr:MAG: UDP-N-acetylglucosamine 1-carboxyvinyltransferase [Candidatus Daviesbacteria bacterium RIFCSPHIGHO2_02_FULL_36_13]OGE43983.1 MAG: UDP-N-acetylglucosamine 1-carboxyvinyltransferase [Candidatus Daviesbacteria bacterium RIFCSPLOWO2_01_FULL_36_8]